MDNPLERLRQCFQPRQWFVHEGEPDPFVLSDEDTFMWVYRIKKDDTQCDILYYEVGYYTPDGSWFCDGTFSIKDDAAARVRHLNGGN